MIRQPRQRGIQRRWIIIGAVVFVLLLSIGSLVRFYTDVLWFGEVGFVNVFWSILWTRVGVGAVGGALAGLFVWANLEVARRSAPRYRFVTQAGDIAEQYRSMFRPYATWVNLGIAAFVGLLTGLSTSTAWERYLLWRNARPFDASAPDPFGRNVAFYVFSIPFQRAILSWLFGIVVAALLLGALGHLLNGAIRPEPNRLRIENVVKVHISVLLGLLALLKAWAYYLDRFELVYSPRGTVTGASYTDVNAQLPALRLLMVIAIVAAVIFFVNLRFRGWLLPGAALALWLFSSILLGAIIPAAVQRFQVVPNESRREAPFIQRNIDATREAFELDGIDLEEFPAEESLDQAAVDQNRGTIENVRIWDPTVLQPTYQRLESIRPYYEFEDVDIDRYTIDGRLTQVLLSAREVDTTRLAPNAQNWVNTRLTYTHGYGVVASPANAVSPQGLPEFLVQDLPPRGVDVLVPERPGIYYGERIPGYSVVNTGQDEIDFQGEEILETTNYDGQGGVELSNLLRRLAFAVRFSDTDLLLSNFIETDSRIMFRRDVVERAETVAPFLKFDHDPYIVVADGKLHWILDAYTSTDRYPYSEYVNLGQLFGSQGGLGGTVNYMRNSVKVVVDAFEGSMDFYIVDPADPLASTYQAAFPDLFKAGEEVPDSIRAHFRYPEGLFMVQAWQYRLYHMLEPQRFYEREDEWDIPADPVQSTDQLRSLMQPYYVVMKLPGQQDPEFLLMLPFAIKGRPILNGWVAARMDPGRYGEIQGFSFPRGTSIEAPEAVSARINQNDAISQQFTLWQGAGSRVIEGNLLVIPIENSLIYVQPIYLQAEQAARALPELRRVIVVIGERIGFERTFEESLEAAMVGRGPAVIEGEEPPPAEDGEPEPTSAPPTGDVQDLLDQAVEHFGRADQALRDGDLAAYQRENEAGQRAVEEARRQSGG